jgi:hypothetical protein
LIADHRDVDLGIPGAASARNPVDRDADSEPDLLTAYSLFSTAYSLARFLIPTSTRTAGIFTRVAPVEHGKQGLTASSDTSEEHEPMSSDSNTPEEEFSEFVRRPTRTAGDLSEVVDGTAGITTEDVGRDLEAVASKSRTPTERELLEELLRRVERIEEHLGIASTGPDDEYLERS